MQSAASAGSTESRFIWRQYQINGQPSACWEVSARWRTEVRPLKLTEGFVRQASHASLRLQPGLAKILRRATRRSEALQGWSKSARILAKLARSKAALSWLLQGRGNALLLGGRDGFAVSSTASEAVTVCGINERLPQGSVSGGIRVLARFGQLQPFDGKTGGCSPTKSAAGTRARGVRPCLCACACVLV